MKRFLWLMCICCLCPALTTACGDDELEGEEPEQDGGTVDPDDFEDLGSRVSDVEDTLSGLSDDVDGLGGEVDDLGNDLDGLSGDIDDLSDDVGGRLDALENPELISCSEEDIQLCIPEGIDLVEIGVAPLIEQLCRLEVGCCTEEERDFKFGGGLGTEEDCIEAFADLVNNGFSPDFLGTEETGSLINNIISIAQALNDTGVRVELDSDAIEACATDLEARECPDESEDLRKGPGKGYYYGICGGDKGPPPYYIETCSLNDLVNGLQEEGEACRRADVSGLSEIDDCAEGLVCRNAGDGDEGICLPPPEAGEACRDDGDCMTGPSGPMLYCDLAAGACAEKGGEGDDCSYQDPTFTDLRGNFEGVPAPDERMECADGLLCDPDAKKCVNICEAGALCRTNADCDEDLVCNKTANPTLTDASGDRLGVCSEPIGAGEPCTVRNDVGDECAYDGGCSLLDQGWFGDSECGGGICMDDPNTDEADTELDPADTKCAPRGDTGTSCSNPDTAVIYSDYYSGDGDGDGDAVLDTWWECDSGYCGPNSECLPPCGIEFTLDPYYAEYSCIDLDELIAEAQDTPYPDAYLYDYGGALDIEVTCPSGHYCDQDFRTLTAIGNIPAFFPVCRPLVDDEGACGFPADSGDIETVGDYFYGDGDGDGDGDYGDCDYGPGYDIFSCNIQGSTCDSGQCFDGVCEAQGTLGDGCEFDALPAPGPSTYDGGYYYDEFGLDLDNLSAGFDTCGNTLFCDPLDEDLTPATAARCQDRIAEGGNCRDSRRNICAAGLVCLNVGDASVVIGGGTATNQVEITVDTNVGADYGSGVQVQVIEPDFDTPATIVCNSDSINITFSNSSSVIGNNTAADIVSLLNGSSCADYYTATPVGDGLGMVATGTYVMEGAYECVTPPTSAGDPCLFGDSGRISCGAYGDGNLACDDEEGGTGLCTAPGGVDDECEPGESECEEGLTCHPDTLKCVELGGDGADCQIDAGPYSDLCLDEVVGDECSEEGTETINRDCVEVSGSRFQCWESDDRPDGSPCTSDSDCTSTFCQHMDGAPNICAPRLDDGANCDRNNIPVEDNGIRACIGGDNADEPCNSGGDCPNSGICDSKRTEACAEDSYCKYPADSDAGKCTPKGATGAECSLHFGLEGNRHIDCLSELCILRNDEYQCAPDSELLCGEGHTYTYDYYYD